MRYQHFRELGMFIGSGHHRSRLKAIVVQRAKQSGMHWTTDGAADIIALRCQHASGRWTSSRPPALPSRQAPAGYLTDTATQTLRPPPPARSFPTILSCTPAML